MKEWSPPSRWNCIKTIDAHAEGEPLRVIISGFPHLPGDTILARRQYARNNFDHLRKALMWEPRGHADMYGCILTPPVSEGSDLGVLFIHNDGYSTMCGHGIIALTTVALETGMIATCEPETSVRFDTPAGLVAAIARIEQSKVKSVRFRNVPSFVVALDETVEVPGLGTVNYDLAFGGAFYAYVNAAEVGSSCGAHHFRQLIEKGMAIKRAVAASREIQHPFEADLSFLYGTIFTGPAAGPTAHSRNVCVFAEGEVDRSPTGTGVSGRLAIHHARGEI
ncbi:MAG TPA: proline racemase family protein, partial [Blastocatellia bacterium]|nr:proline racemase family protein [Blastocatellia bacterium]